MFVPTKVMFRLMMMTFVRTSELTETPWSEIDQENEPWVIDWHRMKMGKKKVNPRKVNHHVFLPRQGWALLRELHAITGRNKYLFPNMRDHEKPATNFGILAGVKRMGYGGKMTGHGFRSLAMGVIKGAWDTAMKSLIVNCPTHPATPMARHTASCSSTSAK